jgi:ADP-heptose:LPS heptosyltransferase
MNQDISNILVKREAAHGDVLVAAAVVPALKKKFPGSIIYFKTKCPTVLVGNPHIDFLIDTVPDNITFNYVCDLDLAYERRPHTHILQSYADEAGVKLEDCEMSIPTARVNKPLFNNYVVIHAGHTNWVGRNWHEDRWEELAIRIHDAGYQIICVGRGADYAVSCDADCRNQTSINELATIIQDSKLFIGIDSLPFHIAQAVKTPAVVFFGSIKPELRIVNDNVTPVTAKNLACLGCHHRKPAPSTVTNQCETKTLECEKSVSVDDIWNIIRNKLGASC